MATLNYTNRLARLQERKFDTFSNRSLVSESFKSGAFPEDIKYLVESMRPIEPVYNAKTIAAAENVKNHLENGFDLHFKRAYRTQGSVMTATNIKTHSDIDLLSVIDKYFYPEKPSANTYTASIPSDDIRELRKQATTILKSIYDEVDDTGESCVSIFNKSLKRKVDVVFCFWYNSEPYSNTADSSNEYYRGVLVHKHPSGSQKKDFPFAHIHNVNYKGKVTSDGSRRGVQLLKNLRADCDTPINALKSFQLTTIVHSIENEKLSYHIGDELTIAKSISEQLHSLIHDPSFRASIKSPNGTETPLMGTGIVSDMMKIKEDLDTLIEDASKDVLGSPALKRALLTY
jgi:hypothetical protein